MFEESSCHSLMFRSLQEVLLISHSVHHTNRLVYSMCMIQFALLGVSHSCRWFSILVSQNAHRLNRSKKYLNYCKCIARHLPGSYAINIYAVVAAHMAHRSQISQVLTRLLDLLTGVVTANAPSHMVLDTLEHALWSRSSHG